MRASDANASPDLAELLSLVATPGEPLTIPGVRWDAYPDHVLSDEEAEGEATYILDHTRRPRAVVVVDKTGTRRVYFREQLTPALPVPTAPVPPSSPEPSPAPTVAPAVPSPVSVPKGEGPAPKPRPALQREWDGPVGVFGDNDPAWLKVKPRVVMECMARMGRTYPIERDERTEAVKAEGRLKSARAKFAQMSVDDRAAFIAKIGSPFLTYSSKVPSALS